MLQYFQHIKKKLLLLIICLTIGYCIINKYNYKISFTRYDFVKVLKETNYYSSSIVKTLPSKGQLLCFVMTTEKYHESRDVAISETWINRCDHGQFFTNKKMQSENIPYTTLYQSLPTDYYSLFWKTLLSFHYAYNNISSDFEWYCKADDDSYLLLNNLKKFLKKFDHTKAYYIGHPLKFNSLKYNSGGTGYILSREAVKQLSEKLIYNETICPFNIFEDEGIGMCLKNINIEALEFTEDQDQSQLFLRDGFESAFNGNLFNYRRNNIRKKMEGIRAISNDLISVHRLSSFEIYLTDKLLYKMNVK